MKRTRKPVKPNMISYPSQDEPLILSKALLDLILAQEDTASLLALYCFYYYTAKWQKTDQIKATTRYTADGIGWGVEKVRKIKSRLKDLGLIEDKTTRGVSNRVTGHFIKVRLIFHPSGFASAGENRPKCFNIYNINASSVEKEKTTKITLSQFKLFWELYPKKVDKGKALTKWNEVCRRKGNARPEWKEIKHAIIKQKKTPRWHNKQFIPMPTTWLNQSRWLDDPKKMKGSFSRGGNQPKVMTRDGVKWTFGADGKYRNRKGEVYYD